MQALRQALLKHPETKAAAQAIKALCPPTVSTRAASFFSKSDMSIDTIKSRGRAISKYLAAVVNDPQLGEHPTVLDFMDMGGMGMPAY